MSAPADSGEGEAGRSERMNPVYQATWIFSRLVFATYFRRRILHADRMPASGPVILASNHASFLDPPLVGSALPRPISYLARESLFRSNAAAWTLRQLHSVPVDRDGGGGRGLKMILERVRSGLPILLFPEGTRTEDGALQPARSGVGLVVAKTRAPVLPVRVFGTFEAFNRHHRFPRPHRVMVKFGVPMEFTELRAECEGASRDRLKAIYQEISDQIMEAITALEPVAD